MDKEYIKALGIIVEKAKNDIQNYCENDTGKGPEHNDVSKSLEKLLQQLEATKITIKNHLRSTNEGYLVLENVSSNYVIKFPNVNSFQPLICGTYLETYINDKGWNVVKIEHNPKDGYQFYNPEFGYHELYENMKVRVR